MNTVFVLALIVYNLIVSSLFCWAAYQDKEWTKDPATLLTGGLVLFGGFATVLTLCRLLF